MSGSLTSERALVSLAAERLLADGADVRVEVPYISRSIDLVYVDDSGRPVVVEFKRRNWRRAIDQARFCLSGCERVYICMPEDSLTPEALRCAEQEGIGVFTLGTDGAQTRLKEKLRPKPTSEQWGVGREWLMGAFYRTPRYGHEDYV